MVSKRVTAVATSLCITFTLSAHGQTASSSGINPITSAAVQTGALTCAARIEQVTNYLGASSDTRAMIRAPQGAPDASAIGLAMTVVANTKEGLATAEFFPNSGSCAATYTVVSNFDESCPSVSGTLLSGQNAVRYSAFGRAG